MSQYLYIFTYRKPASPGGELLEEGSEAIFIEADTPERALSWGREVSEEFARRLDPAGGSWKTQNMAHWVESDPAQEYPRSVLARLPVVPLGAYPNWHGD